uniref:Uncharacterized protein n=1 Tax=Chenopodium quinoa TaxID=63459 RepID=A0A803NE44_CHEQI
MEAQKSESATKPSTSAPAAAATSCRKKKSEEAAFLEDIKDHIDECLGCQGKLQRKKRMLNSRKSKVFCLFRQ